MASFKTWKKSILLQRKNGIDDFEERVMRRNIYTVPTFRKALSQPPATFFQILNTGRLLMKVARD
jgi:hypothetical protein